MADGNLVITVELPSGALSREAIFPIEEHPQFSVKEAIQFLVEKNGLRKEEDYLLYHPLSGRYFADEKRLYDSFSLFEDKVYLELKKRFQVIKVSLLIGQSKYTQYILADFVKPVSHFLRIACKKFQLEEHDDHDLFASSNPLESSKSFIEQGVTTNSTFVLRNKYSKDSGKVIPGSTSETSSAIEPPATYMFVRLPKKKAETRFLQWDKKDNTKLSIYKAEGEELILEMILSEYEVIFDEKHLKKEGDQKKRTEKKEELKLELRSKKTKDTIGFKADTLSPAEVENWYNAWYHATGQLNLRFSQQKAAPSNSSKKEKEEEEETAKKPSVFAIPIENTVKSQTDLIPPIVRMCVEFTEKHGMDLEGIFRKSGSQVVIDRYRERFDTGQEVDISQEPDPHTISGLLKLFFREMPEPLLTYNLYNTFITIQRTGADGATRKRLLRKFVHQLPVINRTVLEYLMKFLARVDEHSAENKMAVHNLATVFAPNLLKSRDGNVFEMVQDTPHVNGVVDSFIVYHDYIFAKNLIAEAQYDYAPQGDGEIPLKKGDQIKLDVEGEPKGWWTGELVSDPTKKGNFPGSFVKIIFPSESDKHVKEIQAMQELLKQNKNLVAELQNSKKVILGDIEKLNYVKGHQEEQTPEVKLAKYHEYIAKASKQMKEDKSRANLNEKLEGKFKDLESSFRSRATGAASKQQLLQQLQVLKKTIHTDPKYKKVRGQKLAEIIDELLIHISDVEQQQVLVDEKKEQIMKSLTQLKRIVKE